jgi:hypothetical protein
VADFAFFFSQISWALPREGGDGLSRPIEVRDAGGGRSRRDEKRVLAEHVGAGEIHRLGALGVDREERDVPSPLPADSTSAPTVA